MNLDVGCGWNPKGDVNVDLFLHKSIPQRDGEQKIYLDFKRTKEKVQQIPNFVCCEVHHLPFQKRTFEIVVCEHLLEHKGVNFFEACEEMLRVSKNKLVITVPSIFATFSRFGGHELHDKKLTPNHFHKAFKKHRRKIKYSRWTWKTVLFPFKPLRFITHRLPDKIPCPIPTELRCEIRK